MAQPSIEDDFRRFRDDGEPTALTAVFDRLAPELLLVAMHLTRRAQVAEDLVQSTFLTAIENARNWDPERPLRPWLVGILTNHARHEVRRRTRSIDPAWLDHPSTDDPFDIAAANELAESLTAHIEALPHPYREVLVLHWVHGLTPTQIGQALGRSPGTVKVQLHRSRGLLRAAVPAALTAMVASALGTTGLAAVRANVLEAATAVPWALPPSTPTATPTPVPGLARWLAIGAVGVVATLATGLVVWWSGDRSGEPAPIDPPPRVVEQTASPEPAGAPAPESNGPQRTAVEVATDRPLRVHVRWSADGTPAASVQVGLIPTRANHPRLQQRVAVTDPNGIATFASPPTPPLLVFGDRGGRLSIDDPTRREAELRIPVGIDLRGRVLDPAGDPVADAEVFLSDGERLDRGLRVARSDAEGRFTLRSVTAGRALSAFADGFAPAPLVPLAAEPDASDEREVVVRFDARGVPVTGRVFDVDKSPIAGALVMLGTPFVESAPHALELAVGRRPPALVHTTDDGRFRVWGVSVEPESIVFARAPGRAVRSGSILIDAERGADLDIGLDAGAVLEGRILGVDGLPAAGVQIVLRDHTYDRPDLDVPAPEWARSTGWTDAAGDYRIEGLLPVRVHVEVTDDAGHTGAAMLELEPGRTTRWDARLLATGKLFGVVTSATGAPLIGWRVTAQAPSPWPDLTPVSTDERGAFEADGALAPHYRLLATPPDSPWPGFAGKLEDAAPGLPLHLTVPIANLPSASIRGRVLEADGTAPQERLAMLFDDERRRVHFIDWLEPGDDRFDVGPLPPGRWRVAIRDVRSHRRWLGPFELAADAAHDLGDIELPQPATLHVQLVDADGQPVPDAEVTLSTAEGRAAESFPIRDGSGGVRFAAGRCQLHVAYHTLEGGWLELDLPAGGMLEHTITLPRSASREFELRHADDGEDLRLEWSWFRADGTLLHRHTGLWKRDANPSQTIEQRFPPGGYRVDVLDHAGRTASATFEVALDDPDPEPIVLELSAGDR